MMCVLSVCLFVCVGVCGVEESAYEAMHEMHALLMDEVVFGDDSKGPPDQGGAVDVCKGVDALALDVLCGTDRVLNLDPN